jgi:hypothetical protein
MEHSVFANGHTMMLCDTNMALRNEDPEQYDVVQIATESQANVSELPGQVEYRIRIPVRARIFCGSLFGKDPVMAFILNPRVLHLS